MIENNFKLPDEKRIQDFESQTVFKRPQHTNIRVPAGTSLGLTENIAGSLTYLFGFISGFIMLLVERENHFVRYHALQSIYISIVFFSAYFLLGLIPVLSWLISMVLAPAGLVLWIILMMNAYKGRYSKMLYISDFANKQL
ncbi:DUF4870 domain-containing protein [Planococcus sp. CAU13]|uniref:DUF4870 domain-containing protein n=1 Tax=Planococcus sp. CAU13 TaxID=1541197 RepID=UPI000ACEB7D7|nr:DUF4870 domain-containing protein [Planococcus sp. CAU13]